MLTSASREYDQQARLTALAVLEAERLAPRGAPVVARSIQTYQAAAVALSMQWLAAYLAEQGIGAAQDATVVPASLLTDAVALSDMLAKVPDRPSFDRFVSTLVRDADRTARAVDVATRPAVTGWVRYLRLPSCSRCVVLAGRVYRYSQGFERHPGCDCGMQPSTLAIGRELVTSPQVAVDSGKVTGLSEGERKALDLGADLGQVVNVRRKAAGLTIGSSVIQRKGRLTPQGCLMFGSDRADVLRLLARYGYTTT